MQTNELTKAMNSLITREKWDLFITVTFFRQTSSLSAKKRFKHFIKYLNTKQRRYYDKFVKTWLFFEKDRYREGVHIHAFLSGIDSAHANYLETECNRVFGVSKILPYMPNQNASFYLARKYPLGVLEDFDFCKINSRIRIKGGDA